ncbi:MAG: hypothetical protein M3Q60_15275 [Actinomycetota bacterium]|nr:hypothetical protein [Actinomycetota bacterium]
MSRAGTQLPLAAIARSRSSRGGALKGSTAGSVTERKTLTVVLLAEPCSP